jgi:hypothetical protein
MKASLVIGSTEARMAKAAGHFPDRPAPGAGDPVRGAIRAALVQQKMLDADGRIQAAFDPKKPDFKIDLPEGQEDLAHAVIDLLASYQIERHIRKD